MAEGRECPFKERTKPLFGNTKPDLPIMGGRASSSRGLAELGSPQNRVFCHSDHSSALAIRNPLQRILDFGRNGICALFPPCVEVREYHGIETGYGCDGEIKEALCSMITEAGPQLCESGISMCIHGRA